MKVKMRLYFLQVAIPKLRLKQKANVKCGSTQK